MNPDIKRRGAVGTHGDAFSSPVFGGTARAALVVVVVVVLLLMTAGCGASGVTRVNIKDLRFDPQFVTVKKGETVEWVNGDQTAHTVTSDQSKPGTKDTALFTSDPLDPGQTYKHTFDQAGTFRYHCDVHPYLKGVVTVTP